MARKPADQAVHPNDIIQAAADVLKDNGYEASTMKDIAGRVNLTAASLYHHFKNKDFLLLAVLELGLGQAIEKMKPIVESEQSASDKLQQMIETHIDGITGNPTVGAAMVFEIKALMNVSTAGRGNGNKQEFIERRDKFFEQRDSFEKMFRETIKAGVASGEFREVDAAIVAKSMLGAQNWVGVWYKSGGRLDGQEIASVLVDTFLRALKK
ncbi:MAG: TetR/AcrR family transcriptional regulator [Phototrophicaceae bacterium]